MKVLLLALMLIGSYDKSLRTDGFHLQWSHQGDLVHFSLSAPTDGWVAIGFTETGDLIDSNLIQGCVEKGKVEIQDQFITGFGEHPPVEALAVPSRISALSGEQSGGYTTIRFSITKKRMDRLHYDLSEERKCKYGWRIVSLTTFSITQEKGCLRRFSFKGHPAHPSLSKLLY